MPAFAGQQLNIPNEQAANDNQHAENVRAIQRWANLIPVTLIQNVVTTVAQSSVTLTVPANPAFQSLDLRISAASASIQNLFLRFNGDSGNNYISTIISTNGTTVSTSTSGLSSFGTVGLCTDVGGTRVGFSTATIQNPLASTYRNWVWQGWEPGTTSALYQSGGGTWIGTTPITSITITINGGGNFTIGSVFNLHGAY